MRWKSSSLKKIGKLMPIPVPHECWEMVSMDFMVGPPVSKGYDSIMTAVDKLSKRASCILTQTIVDAAEVAQIFFMESYAITDYRVVIISDRGPRFPLNFGNHSCN